MNYKGLYYKAQKAFEKFKKKNPDVLELKKRVEAADLSVNNPEIQKIIEKELTRWVESYDEKKEHKMSDCYGRPGEIPDKIRYKDNDYSPNELLEHAKKRDAVGMSLINRLYENHISSQNSIYPDGYDPKRMVIGLVPDNADLNKVILMCMCGKHKKTYRNLMEDIINASDDSIILTVGWPDAIKALYKKE